MPPGALQKCAHSHESDDLISLLTMGDRTDSWHFFVPPSARVHVPTSVLFPSFFISNKRVVWKMASSETFHKLVAAAAEHIGEEIAVDPCTRTVGEQGQKEKENNGSTDGWILAGLSASIDWSGKRCLTWSDWTLISRENWSGRRRRINFCCCHCYCIHTIRESGRKKEFSLRSYRQRRSQSESTDSQISFHSFPSSSSSSFPIIHIHLINIHLSTFFSFFIIITIPASSCSPRQWCVLHTTTVACAFVQLFLSTRSSHLIVPLFTHCF